MPDDIELTVGGKSVWFHPLQGGYTQASAKKAAEQWRAKGYYARVLPRTVYYDLKKQAFLDVPKKMYIVFVSEVKRSR